ncbi:hypothetical protein ES703_104497 [subsurface metagenome]
MGFPEVWGGKNSEAGDEPATFYQGGGNMRLAELLSALSQMSLPELRLMLEFVEILDKATE